MEDFNQIPVQSPIKKSLDWKIILIVTIIGFIGATVYGAYYFFANQELVQVHMATNTPTNSPVVSSSLSSTPFYTSQPSPTVSNKIQPNTIPYVEDEDTLNWKSYTNIKYNYVVKYPENWLGGDAESDADYAVLFAKPRAADGEGSFLAINVIDNSQGLSAAQYWAMYDEKDAVQYNYLGTIELLDGIVGYRYSISEGRPEYHIIFIQRGKIFHLHGPGEEILYKFSRTFKFTN